MAYGNTAWACDLLTNIVIKVKELCKNTLAKKNESYR